MFEENKRKLITMEEMRKAYWGYSIQNIENFRLRKNNRDREEAVRQYKRDIKKGGENFLRLRYTANVKIIYIT